MIIIFVICLQMILGIANEREREMGGVLYKDSKNLPHKSLTKTINSNVREILEIDWRDRTY